MDEEPYIAEMDEVPYTAELAKSGRSSVCTTIVISHIYLTDDVLASLRLSVFLFILRSRSD